jgi:hypothetical protein
MNLYTREELGHMGFGDLVRAIIVNELNCRAELESLDRQGSPYSSEESIRKNIHEKYQPRITQLTDEIDYRIDHLQIRK